MASHLITQFKYKNSVVVRKLIIPDFLKLYI